MWLDTAYEPSSSSMKGCDPDPDLDQAPFKLHTEPFMNGHVMELIATSQPLKADGNWKLNQAASYSSHDCSSPARSRMASKRLCGKNLE